MAQVSRYAPVWETLKQKKIAEIVIAPGLHKRIFKAIGKRKNLDTAYHFRNSLNDERYKLIYELSENKRVMTIKLVRHYTYKDI